MARKVYRFDDLHDEYAQSWADVQINKKDMARVTAAAKLVLAGKAQYIAAGAARGVPWWVVGVWHWRESTCDFKGVLHNGEEIIGTGRKTKLVPAGRGPFNSWPEAADDALLIKGLNPGSPVWTAAMFQFQSERFNGMGYRMRGLPSAYLYAGTNLYRGGKFVEDGVFDRSVWDKQLGVVAIVKRLMELDDSVRFVDEAEVVQHASDERVLTAEEINPDDGLSEDEIKAIQTLLRSKGYHRVGRVDGKWGKDTVGALVAFQSAAGLPVTVSVDRAWVDKTTIAALATGPQAEVGEERAKTTASDLRKAGDPVAKANFLNKVYSAVAGFFALIFGAAQETDTAVGYLSPMREIVTDVPPIVWFGAVAAVAAVIWWQANRAERAAVADVRSGRDAGPA